MQIKLGISIISTLIIILLLVLGSAPMIVLSEPYDGSETTSRTSRANMQESEPNNDFTTADIILDAPMTIESASLNGVGDADYYRIMLEGDDKKVDNLTVKLRSDSGFQYYDDFFISIYGYFEKDYLHMKTVSCRLYNEECPPASVNAFVSNYYFIKIAVTNPYTWQQTGVRYYELDISTKQVTPEDDNQVIEFADELRGPLYNRSLDMALDTFDWYYVDPPDPEEYSGEFTQINFSITVDITASLPMNSITVNGLRLSFVTEVHLLIYRKVYNDYEVEEVVGNMFYRYDQKNPITFYEFFDIETVYIGLYVETYGRTDDGDGEYVAGEGYCDGWVDYSITKLQSKPIISPILANASVKSPVGKIYEAFTYTITYSDENNDAPRFITINIDNGDIGPEPMKKVDSNDKNYRDGCDYYYLIDGSEFKKDIEEHEYRIITEDKEISGIGLSNMKLIGPIITDNILPILRPSALHSFQLYEDDETLYMDMNDTFEDPDENTLYFRLSSDNQNWSPLYVSENITIEVVPDENNEGNTLLEFRPNKNRFNRLSGNNYGGEIVYINVSDDDPEKPVYPNYNGVISRAHYLPKPFELEVIIIDVNDPPEIKVPFEMLYFNENLGEMVLDEDTQYRGFDLNNVFHDPIEKNPLTFWVRENKNIDIVFYSNGTVDIIPHENWTGTEPLEIVADDGHDIVSDSLKVRITSVNDDPVLNYTPKQVLYEDEWHNITFIGYDHADNDPIYFETDLITKLELSEDEYLFDQITGELSFKPHNNNVGTYKDITVTVKDYNGGSSSQFLVLEIMNTPDPPEPTILSPAKNSKFLVTDRIEFQGDFFDPDDLILVESHSYRWSSSIDGNLSIDQNFKGQLSEGEHLITFQVSDSLFVEKYSVTIQVLAESTTDTDKDGIPDYWEILHSLNRYDPQDAQDDPDKDSYSNFEEYLGMDLKVGGNDETNPRDRTEHPDKHYVPPEDDSPIITLSTMIWLTVIGVIIFILIILVIVLQRRRRLEDEAADAEKEEDKETLWQDIYGRKYKVYKYEPNEIICHNCLERLEIQSPIRPLVVTCKKCNKRGVLYK